VKSLRATRLALFCGFVLTLSPAVALASSVPAFTFTSTTDLDGGDRRTLGWKFGVSSSILVTDLGVFDDGSNGLGEAHDVGLWSCNSALCTSGTLLAVATVPAGTGPSLVDFFRYVSLVSPVTLTPGDYVIGAAYYENQPTPSGSQLDKVVTFLDATNDFTLASQITFEGDRVANCGSVPCPIAAVFPDTTTSFFHPSYFGPNFQFTDAPTVAPLAAVPEPSTLVLFGSGIAALIAARRKRS
jgi:hypothetical protein